ncbi:hypothetical protein COOONC_19080 [Cooperia oncophora]
MDRTQKPLAILERMLFERAPSFHIRMRWMGTLASMSIVISDLNERQSRAMTASVDVVQQRKEGDILLDRQPNNGNISIAVPASKATRTQFYHRSGCVSTLVRAESFRDTLRVTNLRSHTFRGLLVRCDNQAACRICKVGSNIESLQRQAEDIWELQSHLGLAEVRVEWIPRERNRLAHKESRQISIAEESWCSPHIVINVCIVDTTEPPHAHETDRRHNRRFSRNNCLVRTSPMGAPTGRDGKNWANFVKDGAFFPVGYKIFTPCPHSNIFNSEFSRIRFMFLLIDFRESPFPQKALTF